MEEASELLEYLPLSFKTESEQEYIAFLWNAFETNYAQGNYQFAFLPYHMLTMCCVLFNIWQIRQTEPADFAKAMVGFNKDVERELLAATSPFTFWRVNESIVFRFLKLIGCDNSQIGKYAELVQDRNNVAHANGNIFYSDGAALDRKISEILRVVAEIERHSKPVIERCYEKFLLEGADPEMREYADDVDQIREVLIHEHYFSRKDIGICLAFDLAPLAHHPQFPQVEALHESLCTIYFDLETSTGGRP